MYIYKASKGLKASRCDVYPPLEDHFPYGKPTGVPHQKQHLLVSFPSKSP